MKMYQGYQNVTLPLSDSIPEHWKTMRNRYLLEEQKTEVGSEAPQYTLLSLSLRGVIPRDVESGKGKFPEKFDKYKVVNPDFLAFCLFDMDETPRTVGISTLDGMLTGAYSIFKVHGIEPRYLYYYYLALDNVKALRPYYTGLRKTININTFMGIRTPIPPVDEQRQIIRFLDWKTSAYNELINARKKEISLLKEKRMSIINEALTKGVNGVALRESTIEGLFMIPETWDEKELKWFVTSNNETLSSKMPDDFELDYIDISTIGFGSLRSNPVHMNFGDAPSRARRIVRKGDTILSTVRTYLKSVCYIDESLDGDIASTGFSVLRPKAGVYPELLSYALCCDYFINSVIKNSIGTSYPAINDSKLLTLKIALPSTLEEQVELFNHITEMTSSTDSVIESLEREISLLTQAKKRLLIDVTTGRANVSEIDIPNYEYVEEESEEKTDEDSDTEEAEEQED
ncbi:restriction endonuclease subunit S [Cloacibacillus evryensis]|uniref:restriction endonuclease subunit S n=1 Tax=Cloacibacillus evryensis TaxID=508460 RepID=UPI000240DFC7|nr:restriction endonuclease subunit S [Cloacibacillus evryensis]EHL65423.1 hypothetical protein HMPREF1006_00436 [Synergistes sp. 3_1_syn1]